MLSDGSKETIKQASPNFLLGILHHGYELAKGEVLHGNQNIWFNELKRNFVDENGFNTIYGEAYNEFSCRYLNDSPVRLKNDIKNSFDQFENFVPSGIFGFTEKEQFSRGSDFAVYYVERSVNVITPPSSRPSSPMQR